MRGAEGAFWFVLALAVAFGGRVALSGMPAIGRDLSPARVMEAQASERANASSVSETPRRRPVKLSGFEPSAYPPAVLYPVGTKDVPDWMSPTAPAASAAPAAAASLPAIAIIIDDVGPNVSGSRRAIALPALVALSFLPYAEQTPALARAAAAAGHDVMVHLPMQAEADADPGPMALRLSQSAAENVRRLDWALSRVPSPIGINNHMGSRFTLDRAALAPVMAALYDRHVFFFDSLTSPRSQAMTVARAFGVASASRDVFLDDVQTEDEVVRQLAILERVARSNGVAVAIGHPHDVTLAGLERWSARLKGVRLVRIKEAIRMKTEREMGVPVAQMRAPLSPP